MAKAIELAIQYSGLKPGVQPAPQDLFFYFSSIRVRYFTHLPP